MVSYFLKQEKECDFAKYTIYHIITISSSDPVNTGRLGWLVHNSISKHKESNALFKYIGQFYDKTNAREKILWYYKACNLINQKLLATPPAKGEERDFIKRLKLSDSLSKEAIEREGAALAIKLSDKAFNNQLYSPLFTS